MNIPDFRMDISTIKPSEYNLGNCIEGYTSERQKYNWKILFINLLPIVGQIIFLVDLLIYLWKKSHSLRIIVFENGFVKQRLLKNGTVDKETVYPFSKVEGIQTKKTTHMTNFIVTIVYSCTEIKQRLLFKDGRKEMVLCGSYHNKHADYVNSEFLSLSCFAIEKAWLSHDLRRFNERMHNEGCASFLSGSQEIVVSREWIKVGDTTISGDFKYKIESGLLYFYVPLEGTHARQKQKVKPIVINLGRMYNRNTFLLAIDHLHGVK